MYCSVSCCTTTTEGLRTRTGKPSPPKGGLVSVLVDSVMEDIVVLSVNPLMSTPMIGIVNDIYIVPVNISYDKVMIHILCSLIVLPY